MLSSEGREVEILAKHDFENADRVIWPCVSRCVFAIRLPDFG